MKKFPCPMSAALCLLWALGCSSEETTHGGQEPGPDASAAAPDASRPDAASPDAPPPPPPEIVEATITQLHDGLVQGSTTPEDLVRKYIDRIYAYGPRLNAYLSMNENAVNDARTVTQTPAASRGLLYGIPIVVKDNIDVA